MDDYRLLDVGDGARLERFGAHVVDRPHGGALAPRRAPEEWRAADLRFDRDLGWSGPGLDDARDGWSIRIADLLLEARPTEAGQVGAFPEHAARLPWLTLRVQARLARETPVEVLNLFAYTGLATLAAARAGARVTHVDSARPSVAWARRNAAANGLTDHPIRWIVEDARAYVRREARRGRRYDGIVLDPPTYGHGAGGTAPWRIDPDLRGLLRASAALLAEDGFVLLSAHTEDFGPDRVAGSLAGAFGPPVGATEAGDLEITAASGAVLRLGAYATLDRASA